MSPPSPSASRPSRATDHLANERTFLAWIRTSLAVIGLGFAVAKFGTWLRELAGQPSHIAEASRSSQSLFVGLVMILTGGIFAVVAAWRHRVVGRQIETGSVGSASGTVLAVTVIIVVLSVAVAALTLNRTRL